jgi:hypothetical protein
MSPTMRMSLTTENRMQLIKVFSRDAPLQSQPHANEPTSTGAEFAGKIEVDMTFLKDMGYIQLKPPSEYSTYSGPSAPDHWSVEFQLVMIIDGRNLRYEARWPIPNESDNNSQEKNVKAQGQISIAAAFQPGTA